MNQRLHKALGLARIDSFLDFLLESSLMALKHYLAFLKYLAITSGPSIQLKGRSIEYSKQTCLLLVF